MPLKTIGTGRTLLGARGEETYADRVEDYGPIAYWPLWEAAGTTAVCQVNVAQNGTYSSDVSTWPVGTGIGDGNSAPAFDGANDFIDVYSNTFRDAVTETQCTVVGWARVSGAGVWTDGQFRCMFDFRVDGNNAIGFRKDNANDQMLFYYFAGAAFRSKTINPYSNTNWFHFACVGDDAGSNELTLFLDGVEQVPSVINTGAWVGAFQPTTTTIGSYQTTPQREWSGQLAHLAWFNGRLSDATILDLATL